MISAVVIVAHDHTACISWTTFVTAPSTTWISRSLTDCNACLNNELTPALPGSFWSVPSTALFSTADCNNAPILLPTQILFAAKETKGKMRKEKIQNT